MTVGRKTGGRRKGAKNKSTLALEVALERAGQDTPDLEPLDYLLAVLRDESAGRRARFEAATSKARDA